MSGYRDRLEAATHRIDSLEQALALKSGELLVLQSRLSARAATGRKRWPWMLAIFGAVLVGALFSSATPPAASAAAPSEPAVDWGPGSTFADPAPRLATQRGPTAADDDDEPLPGETADDSRACAAAERKAQLLVRLASGSASDGELGDLHTHCVLGGDEACRRVTMAAIRARRTR